MYILVVNKDKKETDELKDILCTLFKNGNFLCSNLVSDAKILIKEKTIDMAFVELESKEDIDFARKVKEKNPVVNIIFMSKTKDFCYDAFQSYASGYILKPITKKEVEDNISHLRFQIHTTSNKKVKIQCFGNFEVFVDGKQVKFARERAKELLAYLVDRNGAMCNSNEIIPVLWQDREPNKSLKQQVRNLIYDINKSFKKYDIQDIIIRENYTVGIDKEKVDCDYYDFQLGDPKALQSFRGEYMRQYSEWSYVMESNLQKYFYED